MLPSHPISKELRMGMPICLPWYQLERDFTARSTTSHIGPNLLPMGMSRNKHQRHKEYTYDVKRWKMWRRRWLESLQQSLKRRRWYNRRRATPLAVDFRSLPPKWLNFVSAFYFLSQIPYHILHFVCSSLLFFASFLLWKIQP